MCIRLVPMSGEETTGGEELTRQATHACFPCNLVNAAHVFYPEEFATASSSCTAATYTRTTETYIAWRTRDTSTYDFRADVTDMLPLGTAVR